ncbi:MAG: hypothetical protein ACXWDQ_06235 [Solirubrobacterales bacterium]
MAVPRDTKKRTRPAIEGMHICPECHLELVQPVEWWECDAESWTVELRCPECEWRGNGVYTQAQIDRYDRFLDEGACAVAVDLRALTRENMEHEVDSFRSALATGAVLPEDF